MRSFVRCLLPWLALVVLATARGASPAPEIEVTAVRFTNLRPPNVLGTAGGGTGTWLEAAIALTVRPPAGSPGQMLSRVRVALLVGFELPAAPGTERRIEHYRAEAECVALEAGRADVRFYLPPELVKRDQLHGDPRYWGVEVSAAGRTIPAARGAYSTTLASAEHRKNFQSRGGTAAAANDGIMLPQYLTPFAYEYPRATPSFVRREAR